jgi:DNA mismatch repair ATPase MutS
MMDYLLADDRIVFLYKLKDGRAEQSFGLNVAKVVKIPDSIITKAGKRAKLMEEEITRKDKLKKL